MEKIRIGELLIDTGILLLGDIVNLKKIDKTKYLNKTQLKDVETGKIYELQIDFKKFTDILFDNKTVNELIESGRLERINQSNDTDLSVENIINDIEKGYKQLKFDNGISGKAFAVLNLQGENFYPVYIEKTGDSVERLIIEFTQKK